MKWSAALRAIAGASAAILIALVGPADGQPAGSVTGQVSLVDDGGPVHGAVVFIVGPGLVTISDEQGAFVIENVPIGSHEILAQREHLTAVRTVVDVTADEATSVQFVLRLSPVHEEVTVTSTTGGRVTAFDAFNATSTLDSFDLIANPVTSLGEALESQPGIAKRGFGPGASRPIIRGFDGDRVLVMEDGVRTGDLSSQSGDHGVATDPNGLDRIEIVRGPATLLYGSNSVGGVINAITPHESFKESLTAGTRGQVSIDGGTNNGQAGTFTNVQHAEGRLTMWAGGGARRTSDYHAPGVTVENTETRLTTGRVGVGYAGARLFASGGFTLEDGRYGVPFAGGLLEPADTALPPEDDAVIDLDTQRRAGRLDLGMRNLSNQLVESFHLVFNAIDWNHQELEVDAGTEHVGTSFDNRTYVFRADMNQRQTESLSGRFGVWTQHRRYTATGEEALAPPTTQTAFAVFAYEELSLGRYRLQFGGRLEDNRYTVDARPAMGRDGLEPPQARDRAFTGASASVGFRTELSGDNAFVVNLSRSQRAPALEELYNFGPHVGNLAFEIGNPDLATETTRGLDISLRHQSERLRGHTNVYIYDIDNFVFLDIRNEVVDRLRVANFRQGDGRFIGFDAQGSVRLGSQVWASLGLGLVEADLTTTNEPLPRIPPWRGSLSIDVPYRGFTVTPELLFSANQQRVFRSETETQGYTVLNIRASYVWPRQHMAHVLSLSAFNLTNELYRNHTSFIKDIAPEIGRGVRVGYSLRFF